MTAQDSNIQNIVSIITVVYNGALTISQTIDSVCSQTVLPYEYIIIDGHSTDATVEIVQDYMKRFSFIKLWSGEKHGIYYAMNEGIGRVNGKLVGMINSDDWYEQDAIERMTKAYLANGSGVYYGIQRTWKGDHEFLLERVNHHFIKLKMIPHPTTFVSTDLYSTLGMFNCKYRYSADLELVIRYLQANVDFFPLDHIIANFRLGGASSTPKAALESLEVRRLYGMIDTRAYVASLLKLRLKKLIKR
jgi:glycosyltransferase involved in cell wall biosynthesis